MRIISRLVTLWQWRWALMRLAFKELRVRYKSPALGLLWAFGLPLSTSLVLNFVFVRLVPVPVAGVPFFVFLIAAMFPWNFFQLCLTASTTSMQDNGALIRKAQFPRELIPFAIVAGNLVNFLITLLIVIVFIAAAGCLSLRTVWLLPVAVALHVLLIVGLSLYTAAWQAQYRDTKYIVEVALLVWFYLTPIVYPASTIVGYGPWAKAALLLNPMASVVSVYRASLLGWQGANLPAGMPLSLLFSCAAASAFSCFLAGWVVFQRRAPTMADWVQ